MTERGVAVDHSTIHRWAIKMLPVLTAVCRRRKRPVGRSWRMDETYIKVAGQWKYLYRAVDKHGATVDFLLRAKRDHAAARAFFERAIGLHDVPEKSPSTRAVPTRPPSSASKPTAALPSRCASQNIRTISSSKTIAPLNGSRDPCSNSRPFDLSELSSLASKPWI
jgi:hypothetical protein